MEANIPKEVSPQMLRLTKYGRKKNELTTDYQDFYHSYQERWDNHQIAVKDFEIEKNELGTMNRLNRQLALQREKSTLLSELEQ